MNATTTLKVHSPHPCARFQISGQQVQENSRLTTFKTFGRPRFYLTSPTMIYGAAEMQPACRFQSSRTCAPLHTGKSIDTPSWILHNSFFSIFSSTYMYKTPQKFSNYNILWPIIIFQKRFLHIMSLLKIGHIPSKFILKRNKVCAQSQCSTTEGCKAITWRRKLLDKPTNTA